MEAKTKYQKYIVKLLKEKLSPLSTVKKNWLIDKSFWFYGVSHYSSLICLECGHKWKGSFGKRKTVECTCCKKTLRNVGHHNSGYATRDSHGVFFDRIGEIAVLRIFYIRKHMKKGEKSSYTIQEVVQKCFDPETQKYTLFKRTLNGMMGSYSGGWAIGSELALRGHPSIVDYQTQIHSGCLIYPYKKIPQHFKRAGFHLGDDDMVDAYDQLMYVLLDSRMETIYKYKEKSLLRHFMSTRKMTKKHWSALKIAFRRHYLVEPNGFTVHDWLDHVDLLIEFKKDVSSPHYVCPDDFHAMHNALVKRKRKKQKAEQRRIEALRVEERKQALIAQKKKAIEDQERYVKLKEKYFGIVLEEKELTIDVFKSVNQFMEEGDLLGHCIFANSYYNREESLILSAKVNGEVTETIEVDLREMKLVQARGSGNVPSEYNSKIVDLVERNMIVIEEIYNRYSMAG